LITTQRDRSTGTGHGSLPLVSTCQSAVRARRCRSSSRVQPRALRPFCPCTDRYLRNSRSGQSLFIKWWGAVEGLNVTASSPASGRQRNFGFFQGTGAAAAEPVPTRPVAASSQRALLHFFDYYEQYDSVLFPIAYERFGKTDRVEVIRISPEDATNIVNEAVGSRRKLGGTQLNHFGGFLDASWRRNDLLWGRLDASERLICTIIPEGETPTELLHDAQIAIIEDEFKDASEETVLDVLLQALMRGAGTDDDANEPVSEEAQQRLAAAVSDLHDPEQILAFLKSGYEVDRRIDPQETLRTSGRAARVTADVLDGISKSEPVSWLTRWLSRFGLVLWGLVEVSTPQGFAYVFWQYWRQLLLLISVAMVVVGLLFNIDQVTHAGWIGVVLTITLWLIVWALEDVFRRSAKPRSLLPATLPAQGLHHRPSRAVRNESGTSSAAGRSSFLRWR
jgi:Protein of unknown function (DUF3376)